jgi:hypothetical protein
MISMGPDRSLLRPVSSRKANRAHRKAAAEKMRSAHAPILMGEVGFQFRTMLRNREGTPRSTTSRMGHGSRASRAR